VEPAGAASHFNAYGVLACPALRHDRSNHSLLDRGDVPGLHRILTGLDRDSIEMREVSPVGGLLPDNERLEALRMVG